MAAWSRGDFVTAIRLNIQDPDAVGLISEAQLEDLLDRAVRIYERQRPLRQAFEQTGDGSTYTWAMPSGWIEHFSQVLSVEYPSGEQKPTFIPSDDWAVFYTGTGTTLTSNFRLLFNTPSSSETVRVEYTGIHTLSQATNTIPEGDQEAIGWAASAEACDILATNAAQTIDSNISADQVEHRTKERELMNRAKNYRQKFWRHMGMGENGKAPATTGITEQDTELSWQADFVFHGRRRR
tara:strand:- start:5355 stop:6068 length:714 start_codon:yes stop_codon:yes gene_type:complete